MNKPYPEGDRFYHAHITHYGDDESGALFAPKRLGYLDAKRFKGDDLLERLLGNEDAQNLLLGSIAIGCAAVVAYLGFRR